MSSKAPNRRDDRRIRVMGFALVGVVCLSVFVFRSQRQAADSDRDAKPLSKSSHEFASGAPVGRTNLSLSARIPLKQADPENVDRETMIRCLKSWIRKREKREVEIVSAQDIFDLEGNLKSMNVLVSARLGGGLTPEKLRERLDMLLAREIGLRKQLVKAHQEEDIANVNQLVGELTESRTAFVKTNEVTSYKLSLSKELPPVLAFWPGLPFETVREESARSLAATKLGDETGLQRLVHYTSASALLCFTNTIGNKVYIDPFRITEIRAQTLQTSRRQTAKSNDDGRETRLAMQWAEFLSP